MTEKKQKKTESKAKKPTKEELTLLLQRTQADFENFRKRAEEEKKELNYYFKKEVITSLLPTLDMFELALKHTENKDEFIKGMEMIYAQFLATLENEGLEPIKEVKIFNPEEHEAVMAEESDEKEGTILEELQKGYKINGKVVRCSRVKVSQNAQKSEISGTKRVGNAR